MQAAKNAGKSLPALLGCSSALNKFVDRPGGRPASAGKMVRAGRSFTNPAALCSVFVWDSR